MKLSFSRERDYAGRLAIAFAIAVALHAIAAGLIPQRATPPPVSERVVATRPVTLGRKPRPTPAPSPQPTPQITPAPHYTLAPRIVVRAPAPKAAATPHRTTGGAAAPLHVVPPRATPADAAPPASLADGTHTGEQNGGAGTGAGPGAGTGGLGGAGTGTGGVGNGNGGDTNSAPCGAVYLVPANVSYRPDGTVVQEVLAKIVLHDGTVEIGRFPYPFTYPAERLNPFVHEEALSPDKGIPVQPPPPGTDLTSAPVAVQIVLKYTNPATGTTLLKDCESRATPAP